MVRTLHCKQVAAGSIPVTGSKVFWSSVVHRRDVCKGALESLRMAQDASYGISQGKSIVCDDVNVCRATFGGDSDGRVLLESVSNLVWFAGGSGVACGVPMEQT